MADIFSPAGRSITMNSGFAYITLLGGGGEPRTDEPWIPDQRLRIHNKSQSNKSFLIRLTHPANPSVTLESIRIGAGEIAATIRAFRTVIPNNGWTLAMRRVGPAIGNAPTAWISFVGTGDG